MAEDKKADKQKPICFVLMPIADAHGYEPGHFGRVYEHLLKPAIIDAGFTPVRADDTVKTDYIVVGIIQKIIESEMVLCDFSARNPNVMYELGIRHAFNKPVVLIKDRKTEKIFDIQGLRYTEYDETLRIDAVNKDKSKIAASIRETVEASPGDTNSIVRLAGIRAAELPAGQKISGETELILSAVGALDERLRRVERPNPFSSNRRYFTVYENRVNFGVDGIDDFGEIGEDIYRSGELVGKLVDVNHKRQCIYLEMPDGKVTEIQANSLIAKGMNTIPF